jgi:hypothetical protein
MIRVYAALGLLAALLATGWWGKAQHDRALAAEARADGYAEAARAVNRYVQTVQADRDHWAAVAAETDQIEGRDETVNPYLGAVLDRVRNP